MSLYSVRVENLSKTYGTSHVFDDISFAHAQGVLGIAGPNGSGKSTLLQCLAQLKRPSGGTVVWENKGEPIASNELINHIGYTAPYINLYTELSCAENLNFLLKLRDDKRPAPIADVLSRIEMRNFADHLYGKLSTGQQQRMRIASALIHQPDVLLLDEPGANLDQKGRDLIESLVSEFRTRDRLMILASNNPEELDLCDRVYSVEEEAFANFL